jgi:myo-inositol 2-dehydrogenase/D-chiro-inositol 1-dehydrogenase
MAEAALRLGLIGCGRLAERGYIPALRRVADARLVAAADPATDRCRALAGDTAHFEGAAQLVQAGGVDAVIVASPAASHLSDARAASAAGIPALVEKPPAGDAAEAASVAALAPAPWMGFNRRYEPGLQRLRRRIPAQGEVRIEMQQHNPGGWASHVVRDDALLSLGPHLIDLARWLSASEVEEVRVLELEPSRAIVEMRLGRGTARISCGTGLPHRDRVRATLPDGSSWSFRGDAAPRRLVRRLRRPRLGELVHLLVRELEDFLLAVRGGAPRFLASAADGVSVMRVIDAARGASGAGGGWVPVGGA